MNLGTLEGVIMQGLCFPRGEPWWGLVSRAVQMMALCATGDPGVPHTVCTGQTRQAETWLGTQQVWGAWHGGRMWVTLARSPAMGWPGQP